LPLPQLDTTAAAGVRRFAFELDGVPPGAELDRAPLRLTVVSDVAAIEVTAHLE
jgi:hypothetical protein